MTLTTALNRVTYTGNGSTTVFTFAHYYIANADIVVKLESTLTGVITLQVNPTHYSQTGAGAPGGGDITFETAPLATDIISIERIVPFTQLVDYIANDNFPAESHETALDRLVMLTQMASDSFNRAIRYPPTEATGTVSELPGRFLRKNKQIHFDADGELDLVSDIFTTATDTIELEFTGIYVKFVGVASPKSVQIYLGLSSTDNVLWTTVSW